MDELREVQKQLTERPSTTQVDDMLQNIETTFKSHLGENVFGLKGLVHQVYKHIQNKVDRDDIKRLITAKLTQMEKEIVNREEEMMRLASTTKCLSCGQMPRPHSKKKQIRPGTTIPSPGRGPSSRSPSPVGRGGVDGGGSIANATHYTPTTSVMLDDEISNPDAMGLSPSHVGSATIVYANPDDGKTTTNPYSSAHNEQVYALLTGQVGLKPIQLRHAPVAPVKDPYKASSSLKADKIPEPLYRKARMSQQIKDMVKVQAPQLEQYGFNPANNPLYVMDGYVGSVAEESTSTFLTGGGASSSTMAGAGRNALRSRGGRSALVNAGASAIEYSNGVSVAAVPMKSLQQNVPIFSSSDNGSMTKKSARGGYDSGVVLPDIDMKYSSSSPTLASQQ